MVKRVRATALPPEPEQRDRRATPPALAQSRATECTYCKHHYIKPCSKLTFADCPNYKFIQSQKEK